MAEAIAPDAPQVANNPEAEGGDVSSSYEDAMADAPEFSQERAEEARRVAENEEERTRREDRIERRAERRAMFRKIREGIRARKAEKGDGSRVGESEAEREVGEKSSEELLETEEGRVELNKGLYNEVVALHQVIGGMLKDGKEIPGEKMHGLDFAFWKLYKCLGCGAEEELGRVQLSKDGYAVTTWENGFNGSEFEEEMEVYKGFAERHPDVIEEARNYELEEVDVEGYRERLEQMRDGSADVDEVKDIRKKTFYMDYEGKTDLETLTELRHLYHLADDIYQEGRWVGTDYSEDTSVWERGQKTGVSVGVAAADFSDGRDGRDGKDGGG